MRFEAEQINSEKYLRVGLDCKQLDASLFIILKRFKSVYFAGKYAGVYTEHILKNIVLFIVRIIIGHALKSMVAYTWNTNWLCHIELI